MSLAIDTAAGLLLLAGSFFTLVAGVGVVRMEDIFVRMHASTKAATLGLMLVVVAMSLAVGRAAMIEKGLALVLLVLATAPVSAHLVGRAVWRVTRPTPEPPPDPPESAG